MTDDVRQLVLRVYDAVDDAVASAGPRCDASGRCCRFTEFGHTLFVSHFEAEILLLTAPPYLKPVSADGCPFQVGGLCTAREQRPLGCRIYFCDPAYETRMAEITEKAITLLKRIAERHAAGWRYAPLHSFLNEADRPQDVAPHTMTPAVSPGPRLPLPVV